MTGPVSVWHEDVRPEWIDYNGHLSEAYYVLVFGHATDEVMDRVGLGAGYRARTSASLFTVEAHLRYLAQVPAGASLEVRSSVIGAGPKRLWLWHEMRCEGQVRATEEILGLHVDTAAGRTAPFPVAVAAAIERVRRAPPPDAARSLTL